ncbi:major capsid protein [Edwardsiella phage PVN06]|nr:major capsid protein [Edwardsiella phage PVN06]
MMKDKQRESLKRLLDNGRISLDEYDLMMRRTERPSEFDFYLKAAVVVLVMTLAVAMSVTLADWFSNLL